MAKKKEEIRIPKCTIHMRNGNKYYRIQMKDAEGKYTSVSAKTEEEVRKKYLVRIKEIEDAKFRKLNPTVAEYAEKWLTMQSAHISSTTLRGYTNAMNTYIVKPLGQMYMSDVTADDIKMAMVPLAKRSSHTYATVNMLVKSLFNSAEYSNLITYNPTRNLVPRGGIPSKEREPLTDAQTELLLDTVRDLPPYVFVMIGLYAGMRREEILALKWDCVFLDAEVPYISVRRAWHSEKNRPVINTRLKTKAAKRDIPIPKCLSECLRTAKESSISEYVIADSEGNPLSYSQFARLWNYITVRSTKERTLTRYVNGQAIKKKFKPELGQRCVNREELVYCLDFEVTPHQLRHTYITNLIHAGVDPKTVQYLAGHENSKVTMDIYAKVKYNKPEQLSSVVNQALKLPSSDRGEGQDES